VLCEEDIMNQKELLDQIDGLIGKVRKKEVPPEGLYSIVCQFLSDYAGSDSEFLANSRQRDPMHPQVVGPKLEAVLLAFKHYVGTGLFSGTHPLRQVQVDVVSDFLEQASSLLGDGKTHPAASAVLIGAALEQFLRDWVAEKGLSMEGKKPGIDNYAKTLLRAGLIGKQDMKDITSWAGLRNDAAHGEWDKVKDRKRIRLMLEGVNLFMRKFG